MSLPGAGLLAHAIGGAPATLSVRGDGLSLVMLGLVTLVALVIMRFSQRYLAGEPGQLRYLRALLLILAAVSLLVIGGGLTPEGLWLGPKQSRFLFSTSLPA